MIQNPKARKAGAWILAAVLVLALADVLTGAQVVSIIGSLITATFGG